ncbi:sulfite exporter TauE/SafE family protein [Candidatus Micrarchaeota archaeon]|nr:sulfite exporter TauE/SafE family protein [Candidatus Micrarchaeota archaeon]
MNTRIMRTVALKITGMECRSCGEKIEASLGKMDGVEKVKSDYAAETTTVEFDEMMVDEKAIRKRISELGYGSGDTPGFGTIAISIGVFAIITGIYFILAKSVDLNFAGISMETGFAALLILGFLTGFHCIGMCGGFVLSYAKHIKKAGDLAPHLIYCSGKTISYTAIGALFGLVGSFIAFTPELRGTVAIAAGIFLLVYGLNMLNIFPLLRKLQLRMPAFIRPVPGRGPFVTGLFNGLMIACGPLQALYIFAAGTGSAVAGAQALFFFGLGTSVPLLMFGIASNFLSSVFSRNVVRVSGIFVILLGLAMANNGLNLLGAGLFVPEQAGQTQAINITEENFQVIKMNVTGYGWQPNSFVLKKGIPVRWEIYGHEINGCNNEIIVREYGLEIPVKKGLQIVEFTPEKTGTVRWSCWMGMIQGQFIIIDGINVSDEDIPELPAGAGGCGCGGS